MSSIAERYSRAARSAHLRLREQPGDIDIVAAAGLAASVQAGSRAGRGRALGVLLLRCRHEWDTQRAEFERMYAVLKRDRTAAEHALAAARAPAQREEARERAVAGAHRMDREAKAALATSRALAILAMGSLGEAYARIADLAGLRAARLNLRLSPAEVADCVGTALQIWLDDRCGACAGRGYNGGYGTPVVLCKECGATGHLRRRFPGQIGPKVALGDWVIAFAEEKLRVASGQIHRRLR